MLKPIDFSLAEQSSLLEPSTMYLLGPPSVRCGMEVEGTSAMFYVIKRLRRNMEHRELTSYNAEG